MNFDVKTLNLSGATQERTDVLVVLVGEAFQADGSPLGRLVSDAVKAGDFSAKAGKLLHLYRPEQCQARRLVLVGLGSGSGAHLQQAMVAALGALKSTAAKTALAIVAGPSGPDWVATAVQTAADAGYVYTHTKAQAERHPLQRLTLCVDDAALAKEALRRSAAIALGVELAREWGNRPGNHATPTLLAEGARSLAKHTSITCEVLGPREVAKLKMGAFLGVAQGSEEPLRFIVLKYTGAGKSAAPVVLVGKGITFDTGGISIKPSGEMDEMKFDMCGAASVLGTFRALAELQIPLNVVGLIPACENMPDGRALKPGDVVTSMSGQTIEVLNTDAEGRLVLCDTLTYAERFKPQALVDVATLTGACVIALGGVRSGLFSNDDALATELVAAGESARDTCWRMPLDDEYAEGLKTNFADVANIAGRTAGAVTAAKFLQRFVGTGPWAHLDIAGSAWKGGSAKGATGRPVGLLVHFLIQRAAAGAVLSPSAKRGKALSAAVKKAPPGSAKSASAGRKQ